MPEINVEMEMEAAVRELTQDIETILHPAVEYSLDKVVESLVDAGWRKNA